jgi:hypothetical protein
MMRAGASIAETPPSPRVLLTGFCVKPDIFPAPKSVLKFQVICIDESPNLGPYDPYAKIIIPGEDLTLTLSEYDAFLLVLNPVANSDRPYELILEDSEVRGLWWTDVTRSEAFTRALRFRRSLSDAEADELFKLSERGVTFGGKRHKRSGHKRSGHKRSSKKRSSKKRSDKRSGHKSRRH